MADLGFQCRGFVLCEGVRFNSEVDIDLPHWL